MPFEDNCVKCPYWRRFDNNKITCEGLHQGSTMSTYFKGKGDRMRAMHRFCLRSYWQCPVFKALDNKEE